MSKALDLINSQMWADDGLHLRMDDVATAAKEDAETIATLTAENDKLRRDCALRDLELAEAKAVDAIKVETIRAASGIIQNVSPIGGSNHAPTERTFRMAHEFMAAHLAAAKEATNG